MIKQIPVRRNLSLESYFAGKIETQSTLDKLQRFQKRAMPGTLNQFINIKRIATLRIAMEKAAIFIVEKLETALMRRIMTNSLKD